MADTNHRDPEDPQPKKKPKSGGSRQVVRSLGELGPALEAQEEEHVTQEPVGAPLEGAPASEIDGLIEVILQNFVTKEELHAVKEDLDAVKKQLKDLQDDLNLKGLREGLDARFRGLESNNRTNHNRLQSLERLLPPVLTEVLTQRIDAVTDTVAQLEERLTQLQTPPAAPPAQEAVAAEAPQAPVVEEAAVVAPEPQAPAEPVVQPQKAAAPTAREKLLAGLEVRRRSQ